MVIITIIIYCAITVFIFKLLASIYKKLKYKLPNGPRGLPLIGTFTGYSHTSLWDHREKYGDISYMTVLGRESVVLHTYDVIREAYLHSDGNFDDKSDTFFRRHMYHCDIIFQSLKNSYWRPLRKITHTSLRRYVRGITDTEKVIYDEVQEACELLKSYEGSEFDISEVIVPSVSNTLYILLTGKRFDKQHPIRKLTREYIDIFNDITTPLLYECLERLDNIIMRLPLKLTKMIEHCIQLQNEIVEYILGRNRQDVKENGQTRHRGVIFDLLQAKTDNEWITDENIKGTIKDLMTAGEITTSMTLYALFLVLLHHPDVQHRVHEEIDEVIGRDRRPVNTDQSKMPYTQAVILENMRYITTDTIPFPHVTHNDSKLREFMIPKGTQVLINIFRVHHDPEFWNNPFVFDPQRYLDDDGNIVPATHPHRRNMLTFGMGTRACIGDMFAKSNLFLFVTHFLQKYKFIPGDYLPTCDPRTFVPDHAIHPAPYKLRIVKRY